MRVEVPPGLRTPFSELMSGDARLSTSSPARRGARHGWARSRAVAAAARHTGFSSMRPAWSSGAAHLAGGTGRWGEGSLVRSRALSGPPRARRRSFVLAPDPLCRHAGGPRVSSAVSIGPGDLLPPSSAILTRAFGCGPRAPLYPLRLRPETGGGRSARRPEARAAFAASATVVPVRCRGSGTRCCSGRPSSSGARPRPRPHRGAPPEKRGPGRARFTSPESRVRSSARDSVLVLARPVPARDAKRERLPPPGGRAGDGDARPGGRGGRRRGAAVVSLRQVPSQPEPEEQTGARNA